MGKADEYLERAAECVEPVTTASLTEKPMTDQSAKDVAVAAMEIALLGSMTFNGHLVGALVKNGALSMADATEIFTNTADVVEKPLGPVQQDEAPATSAMRSYVKSLRGLAKTAGTVSLGLQT